MLPMNSFWQGRLSRILKAAIVSLAFVALVAVTACAQKPASQSAKPAEGQSAEAQLATFTYDFEKGERQGWGQRGTIVVETNAKAAHSGGYGIAATGRGETWSGPAIQLGGTLKAGAVYEIAGWIKLPVAPGTASTVKFTMEEKPAKGDTKWKTIGEAVIADSNWVELKGTYTFTEAMTGLSLYAESSATSDDIYIDDIIIKMTALAPGETAIVVQKDLKAIKDQYAGAFSIGTAVTPNNISGTSGEMILKHFNSVVAENAMKSMYIHPTEKTYYWDEADKIVAFAKENKMELRYHTLLWHEQCAPWFFLDADGKDMSVETDDAKRKANKALLLKRLDAHVRTIVSRYKKDIVSWDVVNEVIDASEPDGLRRSKWFLIAGEDYLETAFRAARKAGGKKVKLYINDYSTDDPAKKAALLRVVRKLIEKKVPIDGVGHQCHISIDAPAVGKIGESIKTFAELGLDNQITELDVSVYGDDATAYTAVPEDLIVRQGYRFKELFDELLKYKDSISSVTFWGIADNATWLHNRPIPRRDAPFAFDENYQAKPAYWGMIDPTKLPPAPAGPRPLKEPKLAEALYGTIAVDGTVDAAWKGAKQIDVTIPAVGKPTATGKARMMWDDAFLYAIIEVTDPVLDNKSKNDYEKDSVEFYLDENNAKTTTYQADDAQYRVTFENVKSFGSNGEDGKFASAVKLVKGGYVVEMAIPFRTIKPAKDLIVGFEAQINDGDGTGIRQGISKWNDPTDNSYRNTLNWGTLKLVK